MTPLPIATTTRQHKRLRAAAIKGDLDALKGLLLLSEAATGAAAVEARSDGRQATTRASPTPPGDGTFPLLNLNHAYSDDCGATLAHYLASGRMFSTLPPPSSSPSHPLPPSPAAAANDAARAIAINFLLRASLSGELPGGQQLDLSLTNSRGESPLHCALLTTTTTTHGSPRALRALMRLPAALSYPPALSPRACARDAGGRLALEAAADAQQWHCVAELLTAGGAKDALDASSTAARASAAVGRALGAAAAPPQEEEDGPSSPSPPPSSCPGALAAAVAAAVQALSRALPLGAGCALDVLAGGTAAAVVASVQAVAAVAGGADAAARCIVAGGSINSSAGGNRSFAGAGARAMDAAGVAADVRRSVDAVAALLGTDASEASGLLAAKAYDARAAVREGATTTMMAAAASSSSPLRRHRHRRPRRLSERSNAAAAGSCAASSAAPTPSSSCAALASLAAATATPAPCCIVCFEPATRDSARLASLASALPRCSGHPTCDACWKGVLRAALSAGEPHRARCPLPSCRAALPPGAAQFVLSLGAMTTTPCSLSSSWTATTTTTTTTPEAARYARLLAHHVVDVSADRRWCPRPGCALSVRLVLPPSRADAVASDAASNSANGKGCGASCTNNTSNDDDPSAVTAALRSGRALDVACACGHRFCWACKEPAHEPAPCAAAERWRGLLQGMHRGSEQRTRRWLAANTKRCPSCRARTMRRGGCNHIVCKCEHEWCWSCLRTWSEHSAATGGYYACTFATAEAAAAEAAGAVAGDDDETEDDDGEAEGEDDNGRGRAGAAAAAAATARLGRSAAAVADDDDHDDGARGPRGHPIRLVAAAGAGADSAPTLTTGGGGAAAALARLARLAADALRAAALQHKRRRFVAAHARYDGDSPGSEDSGARLDAILSRAAALLAAAAPAPADDDDGDEGAISSGSGAPPPPRPLSPGLARAWASAACDGCAALRHAAIAAFFAPDAPSRRTLEALSLRLARAVDALVALAEALPHAEAVASAAQAAEARAAQVRFAGRRGRGKDAVSSSPSFPPAFRASAYFVHVSSADEAASADESLGGGGWLGWFWRRVLWRSAEDDEEEEAAAAFGGGGEGGEDDDCDGFVSVSLLAPSPPQAASPPSEEAPSSSSSSGAAAPVRRTRVALLDAAELLPAAERRGLRFVAAAQPLRGHSSSHEDDGEGGGVLAQQLVFALAASARQEEVRLLVVEARAALAALLRAGRLGLFDGAAKKAGAGADSEGGVVIASVDHVHLLGAVREGAWTFLREAIASGADAVANLAAAARNGNGN